MKRLRGIADDAGGFIVDGFNFVDPETKHYFLTHFHSDHTTGLHASFDIGTIYCSAVTAELVVSVTGVKRKVVIALEIGETSIVQGVEVTPLNANHCPGAVMFHFRDRRSGRVVLHTGDFRASTGVCEDPQLRELLRQSPVDLLYLDTTYCKPAYTFPDQAEVCATMARITREELEREPQTLFVVGSYSIGKENAIEAVARAASSCALVSPDRARTLRLSGRWDDSLYTECASERTLVHVSSLLGGDNWHDAALKTLKDTGRFNALVGFRPTGDLHRSLFKPHSSCACLSCSVCMTLPRSCTHSSFVFARVLPCSFAGWTFTKKQATEGYKAWTENGGRTRLYAVPYSEHSSYSELRAFVHTVRPRQIIPTVNAMERNGRERLVAHFLSDMDLSRDPNRIECYFGAKGGLQAKRWSLESSASETIDLDRIDLAEQMRLWASVCASNSHPSAPEAALSSEEQQLGSVIGQSSPLEYVRHLLRESGMSVGDAAELHFGANGGAIPAAFHSGGRSLLTAPTAREDIPEAFPRGAAAVVWGTRFLLFRQRARIEERLRQLGARVQQRITANCSLVIIPENESASHVTNCPKTAKIFKESWLMRHVRLSEAQADDPTAPARASICVSTPPAAPSPRKRAKVDKRGGRAPAQAAEEQRGGPLRKRTKDKLQRLGRALNERLYLLSWKIVGDDHHEFAVLGSTGNVYTVRVARLTDCSCQDAQKGHTCKHIYFVICKVLKTDTDSDLPFQRHFLRSELREMLPSRPPILEHDVMADMSVRSTFRDMTGTHVAADLTALCAVGFVERRPLEDNPCAICFEALSVRDALGWCQVGCGFSFHEDCLTRWFSQKQAEHAAWARQCPRCRSRWSASRTEAAAAAESASSTPSQAQAVTDEGYINLAHVAGVSRLRDTRTYSEWLRIRN